MIVIVLASAYFVANGNKLRAEEAEAMSREADLQERIDAENQRTEELEEEKKHVKTDQYIKEVARDKLGLIDPGEVIFREEEE